VVPIAGQLKELCDCIVGITKRFELLGVDRKPKLHLAQHLAQRTMAIETGRPDIEQTFRVVVRNA